MASLEKLREQLVATPATWLVTGAAGFIGSNLVEFLLSADQLVVGLDNFSTGHHRNLEEVRGLVTSAQWQRFTLKEGDITRLEDCQQACSGCNHVLHQAALGSVPRSLESPIATNQANIDGFLNILVAAREANVQSFTYAASSSTYGDHPGLPKIEANIGKPLSPYAVTKYVNELYADVFARCYDFQCVGLRYFNVFGRRQDPDGAYAAVIPKWVSAMIRGEKIFINGDGETSRDFCYIDNAVQANILAALAPVSARNQVYNVAVGDRNNLNALFAHIVHNLQTHGINYPQQPIHLDFRAGDVRHSQADISLARDQLGYKPSHRMAEGLAEAILWYIEEAESGA